MRFSALLACALVACATPSPAANLIADGGFEDIVTTVGGYGHFAGGSSFDGGHWFATGVDILWIDRAYSVGTAPPMTFNAHGGRTSLDLTGTGNSGPLDGVYQDIATVAAEAYTLSFFVGRAVTTGSLAADFQSDATMRVTIDGGPVHEFVNAATVESGIAWQGFGLDFTASGASTRIAFANGLGNDYLGLDDVVVTPSGVPEPASWAMLLVGFALAGVGLRRTRPASA